MHILMIGGTRYIGRVAVQRLLDMGNRVTVFSRGNNRPNWWQDVSHIIGDRTDTVDFHSKLVGDQFDAVIDTFAMTRQDVESAITTFNGNVGRYLFVSTGSVYMDGHLDFFSRCPFNESDVNWSNIDYSYPGGESKYGAGKRHCEKWLQENSTVPYTIIRIPAVMGWDDPSQRMWWWVQRALDGGSVVIPEENHSIFRTLYVEDAADAWIRAISCSATLNQTYHISMKEIMTAERWSKLIWSAAGHECSIAQVPRSIINSNEHLGPEFEPPLLRRAPYIQDLGKAERDFGFNSTPVSEWIQKTVDWYREDYDGHDSIGYDKRGAELALADHWASKLKMMIDGFKE